MSTQTTTYTRDFTTETYPPLGLGLLWLGKETGKYPQFGIDANGLYLNDQDAAATFGVAFIPLTYRHRKQGYTAQATFMLNVTDTTKDALFGILVGSTSDQSKVYLVQYSLVAQQLKITERDYGAGTWTDLATSSTTYAVSNNVDYVVKVTITYDDATQTLTVSATLEDTSGTVLLDVPATSITGAYPAFGLRLGSGYAQTGYVYVKGYTITYDGAPDTTLPELQPLLDPDLNTFDWVGAPMLVWWEDANGQWSPYNPTDGLLYVVVRQHGEASNVGDRIDMYKINGDPRDPASYVFVKTVFDRSQLGWSYLEEFNLLVKNDGTYIALVAGGTTGYAIHRLVSTDGGTTWTDEGVKINGKHNHIYVESDGTIIIAWWDLASTQVNFSKSTDLGVTFTQLGALTGYKNASLHKNGDKYLVLANVISATDNTYYIQHLTDLFETADFNTFTKLQTVAQGQSDAPLTGYHDGFFYTEILPYNGYLYAIGETAIVDHDPDDDLNDQEQRHLVALVSALAEIITITPPTTPPPSTGGGSSLWWIIIIIIILLILGALAVEEQNP